jgi:hypothetical protein
MPQDEVWSSPDRSIDAFADMLQSELWDIKDQVRRQADALQEMKDALRHIARCATDIAATQGRGVPVDCYEQLMRRIRKPGSVPVEQVEEMWDKS